MSGRCHVDPTVFFCFAILAATIGCQPTTRITTEKVSFSPSPPVEQPTESSAPQVSLTERIETPEPIFPQYTPENSSEGQSKSLWISSQRPVFVEVTHSTTLGKNENQRPVIGVGSTSYFYDPNRNILMLNPKVILEPTGQLLIGVNEVLQTADQIFEKRDIFPYPAVQPGLIQIAGFDQVTNSLTITFDGEKFDLAPGEQRTFKQENTNSSSSVIIISNYGELKEVQPIVYDGSLP